MFLQEKLNLDKNIHRFLDEVTDQLDAFMHHADFKETLLLKVANSWRFKIGMDINAHFETETEKWEQTHIHQIYQDIFVNSLNEKLKSICGPLAETLMKGFDMHYNPENTNFIRLSGSIISVVGGCVFGGLILQPPVAVGVAVSGVVFSGLASYGYFDYHRKACEGALNDRIRIMSKTKIKEKLTKRYIGAIKSITAEALKTMKCEINILKEEAKLRETEHNTNTSRISVCIALDETVFQCKLHLQQIENLRLHPTKNERAANQKSDL